VSEGGPGGWLSEDEGSTILAAALAAAGEERQTEDDIVKVIGWAQQTRMHEYALALVLAGHMGACIRDGELTWKTLP
jgi:hypothetical protein